MFNSIKKKIILNRVQDEILYEYVAEEIEDNIKVKGLWAKAYSQSEGDSNKVEPLYMQYRVQAIKDTFSSLEMMYTNLSRSQLFEFISNEFKDPNEEILVKEKENKQKELKKEEKKEEKTSLTKTVLIVGLLSLLIALLYNR